MGFLDLQEKQNGSWESRSHSQYSKMPKGKYVAHVPAVVLHKLSLDTMFPKFKMLQLGSAISPTNSYTKFRHWLHMYLLCRLHMLQVRFLESKQDKCHLEDSIF